MGEACKSGFTRSESFACGSLVAVKDKDVWYRGQVTNVQGSMFKVFMLDVGKERCFQLYELKALPELLGKVPAQAIKCCLQKTTLKSLTIKSCDHLKALMGISIVAHFVSSRDHIWKVGLYTEAQLEGSVKMQAKQLSGHMDKKEDGTTAHSQPDSAEPSADFLIPCTRKELASIKNIHDISLKPNKELGVNGISSSPASLEMSEDSFSPSGSIQRSGAAPFTSTTRLDLASNSVSPSALLFEDTASSNDTRSTVRDISVLPHEDLDPSRPVSGSAPLKIHPEKPKVEAADKPCIATSQTSDTATAVQYIASCKADMVINAVLAKSSHSQVKLASETQRAPLNSLSSEKEASFTASENIKKDANTDSKANTIPSPPEANEKSLLWDSRFGGLENSENKLGRGSDTPHPGNGGSIPPSAEESLLWDSRIGALEPKVDSPSTSAKFGTVPSESLVWDSKDCNGSDSNESQLLNENKSLKPAEESLLWDSRYGALSAKECKLEKADTKPVPSIENSANESLLWNSKYGGLTQNLEDQGRGGIDSQASQDLNKVAHVNQASSEETNVMEGSTKITGLVKQAEEQHRLKLPLQAPIDVSVAFVDGLSVWVQLEKHLDALSEMMETLHAQMEKEHCNAKPQIGEQCISKYHLDEGWYRATIVDVDSNQKKLKVHYVDYGNTELVEEQNVFVMLPQFKDLPYQALHCRLPEECKGWLEPYQDQWEGLVGKSVKVSVKENREHIWNLVSLEVDGVDLVEEIKKSIPITELEEETEELQQLNSVPVPETKKLNQFPPQSVSLASGSRVFVCFLTDEAEVWLQKVADTETIEDIVSQLVEPETEVMTYEGIEEGLACLAQSNADGLWYRAKIVSFVEPDQITVHFVDYGNFETISNLEHMREITKELLEVSPLAHCCILECTGKPHEINLKSLEEYLEQELVVKVLESAEGKTIISLFDGKHVLLEEQEQAPSGGQTEEAPLESQVSEHAVADVQSRKWYAPTKFAENGSPQSVVLQPSSVSPEEPKEEMPKLNVSEGLGNGLQESARVFMDFRKARDPLANGLDTTSLKTASSVSLTRASIGCLERSSTVTNLSSSNTEASRTTSLPSLVITTVGVNAAPDKEPSVGSVASVEMRKPASSCIEPVTDSVGNGIGKGVGISSLEEDKETSKHNEKEVVNTGTARQADCIQTTNGKRFLDCIEEVEESNEDTPTEIQINSYTAYLVHVEESPFSLWVQREEDNDLAEYIETWYKEHDQERAEAIEVEDVYVTVLGESAQRVRIQCIEDANVTVLLIDQGKRAIVSKEDLYKLPESLMDIHPLATQIYLPVKVAQGRESGAVIAVAEVAHQSKCVCVDLDDTHTMVWCTGIGELGDFLVDNKLATPINWNLSWRYRYIATLKRRLEEEASLLTTECRQESSFYQTADTDLAMKLEQSLKALNVGSAK